MAPLDIFVRVEMVRDSRRLTTKFTRGAAAQRTLKPDQKVGRQRRRVERLVRRLSAVPFEARISALLSIFG